MEPEDINLMNKHASSPYNPNIAHVFYLAGFIPASNEPSGHAGMSIWRLPRGSNTPMLA